MAAHASATLWPWLLAGGPAIVVVASLCTAWMAVRSDDGLVAQDYYKRGLMINQTLRHIPAGEDVKLGAVLHVGASGDVRARVSGLSQALPPHTLRLKLSHPSAGAPPLLVVLERRSDGDYVGRLGEQTTGRWIVNLESDLWRLPTTTVSGRLTDVRLGASAEAS